MWRPVFGAEGLYEVSDRGEVRSRPRERTRGGILAPRMYSKYMMVDLGRGNHRLVHRLVLEAFIGPCPPGLEARHVNGDHTDNSLPNLLWGTRSENTLDQVRHGVHANAIKTHCPLDHPYDGRNTGMTKKGSRYCRACAASRMRRARETVGASA